MKPLTPVKERCLSPVKSMRKFCLTRCEDGVKRVRLCSETDCPLHPYRLATQPNRAGIGGGKRPSLLKSRHSSGEASLGKKSIKRMVCPASLLGPGSSGEEIGQGQINLETRGKIMIKKLGKELVITLTEVNLG